MNSSSFINTNPILHSKRIFSNRVVHTHYSAVRRWAGKHFGQPCLLVHGSGSDPPKNKASATLVQLVGQTTNTDFLPERAGTHFSWSVHRCGHVCPRSTGSWSKLSDMDSSLLAFMLATPRQAFSSLRRPWAQALTFIGGAKFIARGTPF